MIPARGGGIALLAAAALAAMPLHAQQVAGGFIPQVGGSQLMLFVSRPLFPGMPARNTWGLRFERASPVASASSGPYCAPLRHRTLVELQMPSGGTPRLMFGRNVGWDIERGQFGSLNRTARPGTLSPADPGSNTYRLP